MTSLRNIKQYKRKVDNRMRSFGETDLKNHTIRINKKKARKVGRGELLDTIVHEKEHILHPLKKEKTVRRDTTRKIAKMSPKAKQKHYKLFS